MPENESNPNEIKYGVNERGDFVIDGIVVDRNPHFYGDVTSEVPIEDDASEGKENAAVEGESAVPAPPPLAPVDTPPAPEPPKIPEKQKYKLMVRGEMKEKEYSNDEIVARLQMAESYDLRNDELRKKHKEIEPFLHVFERPDFKEWLETKVQVGEITPPSPPPPPAGDEVVRYRLRTQDPEFSEIKSQMIAWAATLPDNEAEIINTNYRAFNEAYDHFKATRQKPTGVVTTQPLIAEHKREIDKVIAQKEVVKQQARVEPPGGAPVEVDQSKEWQKVDRQLQRAVQSGEKAVLYKGKRMDPEVAWIMHRTGD